MKKNPRPNTCNVLSLDGDTRHLWQFNTSSQKISLATEDASSTSTPLPAKVAAKDWRNLFTPRLNIAWLPPESVFLRVVQLPPADAAEFPSMVELQLEKLSPMPVAQIVWTFALLPRKENEQQTVILVVVARSVVEEYLGKLETMGYLADRLELPFVHQLAATTVESDGAWIYPRATQTGLCCVVAWWYGGVLRELGMVHLPSSEKSADLLYEQLCKMAWNGELEGWLTSPPQWHLVADSESDASWAALLENKGESVVLAERLPARAVAEIAVQKVAGGTSTTDLLPAEFAARYRQQYVDRLWMRSLLAVGMGYALFLAIYFGWLFFVNYQKQGVTDQIAALSGTYTNALQLKARGQILAEQANLKYAALDSWKLASSLLPAELKLTSFSFSKGKTVTLYGQGPADAITKLTDFNEALAKASLTTNGSPYFATVNPPRSQTQGGPAGGTFTWSFSCEINRSDIE